MKNKTNEIVKYEDHAEVILYDKYGNEKARALIDLEDIEKVKNEDWHKTNGGYVLNSKGKQMHRIIIDCPENKFIDHINHNKLDNRKHNLRIVTKQQNAFNMKKPSTNTSGYKGVGFHKQRNKWRARIMVDNKDISLGLYDTIEEAIKARKEAEIKYFGEYRNKEDEA